MKPMQSVDVLLQGSARHEMGMARESVSTPGRQPVK
jgi:hypothetical protein